MPRALQAADLFCGAGGTSTGLLRASIRLGKRIELVAVNHWQTAVDTHSANHPKVRHLCASVDSLNPREAVPGGKLDLLIASPECTHHSKAKGSVPVSDQKRSGAWHVHQWATSLQPEEIVVENVPCFSSWGPLDNEGRPIKKLKGQSFSAWLDALSSLGYHVDHRVLVCADYGDPTTRPRLFVRASRKGPIQWPTPSHGAKLSRPWRTAREIIDWSDLGQSIFQRPKPLVAKTLSRIQEGVKRFCTPEMVEPFLLLFYGRSKVRSIELPIPTVTAHSNHLALIQPFLLPHRHAGNNGIMVDSIDRPLRTLTASNADDTYLVTADGRTMDIYFRMLKESELAAGQGFPEGYVFTGRRKKDRIRQIGNAVPPYTAEAVTYSALASL